ARGRQRAVRRDRGRAPRRPDARLRARAMRVGVPTETKPDEYRVALTPSGARELAEHGHEVVVQSGAGEGSAIADSDYEAQGAGIVADSASVLAEAELILKVKEPQPEEVVLLRPEHTLFAFLHLA